MSAWGTIAPLDGVRRLRHGTLDRSSCYLEKKGRLGRHGLRRLNAIEHKLVTRYASPFADAVADCGTGVLSRLEGSFLCEDGSLDFFWSGRRRVWILSDFELAGDGEGGSSSIADVMTGPGREAAAAAARRRMAAASVVRWAAAARLPGTAGRVRDGAGDRSWPEAVGLPAAWAALIDFALVPEQLANPFARSIVAGWLACRAGADLASAFDRPALRGGRRGHRAPGAGGRRASGDEAIVLRFLAIADPGAAGVRPIGAGRSRSRRAVRAARAAFLKGELLARVSRSLSRRWPDGPDDADGTRDEAALRALLRSLSLFGGLIRLCTLYFGAGVGGAIPADDGRRGGPRRAAAADTLRRIAAYEEFTDRLADLLALDGRWSRPAVGRTALHGEIVGLVHDIFDARRSAPTASPLAVRGIGTGRAWADGGSALVDWIKRDGGRDPRDDVGGLFKGEAGRRRLVDELSTQRLVGGIDGLADDLASEGELLRVRAGERIATRGDVADGVYFILSGTFGVAARDGRVASRGRGDVVGETTWVSPPQPRSADVIARDDAVVLRVPGRTMEALGERHPQLLRRVAGECAARLLQRGELLRAPNDGPRVFLAFSVEASPVAQAVRDALARDPLVTVAWTTGMSRGAVPALEALEKEAERADFAIAIAHRDDRTRVHGDGRPAPRAHVVFELGFLVGVLGRDRTILMEPAGEDAGLSVDMAGLTTIRYSFGPGPDAGARIAPACDALRDYISLLGVRT